MTSLAFRLDEPPPLPQPLFPYQRDGVRALLQQRELLLADDMGLGKTIQAIAALRVLVRRGEVERALLVLPASLVLQWKRALREWAPELRTSTAVGPAAERSLLWRTPAHVYLTSYECLRSDFGAAQAPVRRLVWDVVVLDEAQRIKNREVETARVCKRLQRRRSWALTGTPLENRVDDLASICEFLAPWREGDEPLRVDPDWRLRERHRRLQLRRRKGDVLAELPAKTVVDVPLALEAEQRRSYERAERDGVRYLRELGREVRIAHVLELIQTLKQLCNVCPESGSSAKLDDLDGRLETLSAQGHRALVFSQYTSAAYGVGALERRLRRFRPLAYTGALDGGERDRVVRLFKQDDRHKALLLSLRAGGQGLNLQEASYVVHFDRWWNPAVERQAEDRSHRLGQTMPVTVYRYVCERTIEQRIDDLLREKQALFDALVDGVTIDLRRALSDEEIFGLFGLEPPMKRTAGDGRGTEGGRGES